MKNMPIVRLLFPEGVRRVYSAFGDKLLPYYVSDTNHMFVKYEDKFLQIEHINKDYDRTMFMVCTKPTVFVADDFRVVDPDDDDYWKKDLVSDQDLFAEGGEYNG